MPIIVAKFRDDDRQLPSISAIIRADLERSGVFRLLTTDASLDESAQPNLAEWRTKASDALVVGSVTRLADNRLDIRFKLWDILKGVDLGGQSTVVQPAEARLAAHRIADYVYEKLTGNQGVFSTRIAYVSRSSGKYILRVADADGEGGQNVLTSPEAIISPVWSPDGRELAYVSFESQKAVVYVQEVQSGRRRVIANFKGSNSAPAWSPDGSMLALTLSRDGGSQIHIMGRNAEGLRRLTSSNAIDTEPTFSPDAKTVYFVSDRGGSPQIYRVPTAGGAVERVTFTGAYNISPAISPDGRTLAFISRLSAGEFRLHVQDLASGTVQALTDTSEDESPSFAPNGKLIIFATRDNGRDVLLTSTLDGKFKARLMSPSADVREPAWGPLRR